MRRRTSIAIFLAAVAVVSAAVLPLATGSARRHKQHAPVVKFKTVRGPEVAIAPFGITGLNAYNLRCPRGYVATGYGVGLGATELVYADPSVDGRGYDFAFANPSELSTFHANGSLRCATGRRAHLIASASAVGSSTHAGLIADARRALRR